jgi:putative endonuclease
MFGKKEVGKLGEDIASSHIFKNGYSIIERNFRTKFGEIDIIAKDHKYIAFIEVKTRKGTRFGYPREAVDKFKQSKIKNIASLYLAKKKLWDSSVRFDVVEIILDDKNDVKSVVLIKNAFD